MKRTVFICINGIRSNPSDPRGWTDAFVTSLNIDTPEWVQAEKFEYYTSAVFRWIGQRKRAEDLVFLINTYLNAGYRVVLIGHSNGADLIARAFKMGVRVDSIHLFAAAADEKDFVSAIENKLVQRVHLYGSADDAALKTASLTRRLLGLFGLGYGSLGLDGSTLANKYPSVVKDHSMKGYGHSTWFQIEGGYYKGTMALLMANERSDRVAVASEARSLEETSEHTP